MNPDFENYYANLDAETRHVYHVLAICPSVIDVFDLLTVVSIRQTMTKKQLHDVLIYGQCMSWIKKEYYEKFMLDASILIWIFPLIKGYDKEKKRLEDFEKIRNPFRRYYSSSNKYLIDYLDTLWHHPIPAQLADREKVLLGPYFQKSCLLTMLMQPLYEEVYERFTEKVVEIIYRKKSDEIVHQLDPLDALHSLDAKLTGNLSCSLTIEQAKLAFIGGDWQRVQNMMQNIDSHVLYYAEASERFASGDHAKALQLFEKGLKKQRRDLKQSYIPVIPEAALFYFVTLISDKEENYLPVFERINDYKTKRYAPTDNIFLDLCRYMTSNDTEKHSNRFKSIDNESPEMALWKVVALGFIGEHPYETEKWMKKALQTLQKALTNGYLPAAYEAAYALKNMESEEATVIYAQLSEKLKYKPALSRIKRVEAWEKQISAYLSLDAVKLLVRKESEAGKTRVAYRFYPKTKHVQPVLQTRQDNVGWTAGRNISLSNFCSGKTDGMTEQDKRIAAAANYYSNYLDKRAIIEMAGHPYVFLENSDIPVQLIAARPVLSVVESSKGGYKLESDVTDLHSEVFIEKETNTRYKIYHIDKQQREIIEAVKKGQKIPEAGKEKLLKVLEHFSAHMTVQTDLAVSGDHVQARQVEADSRIRVQLLPLGEGLKAEMFVKPFGAHPPYCKPGKGGKALMANQNGERLQVTRNMELEMQFADRILTDIQTIESFDVNEGVMTFGNPLDALELLDILRRHGDITVVEWPEGERLKVRYSANFENLNLRMKSGVDWFELEGELKLDEEMVVSIGQLLELVQQGHGRFVELAGGEFIALSEQFKRRLAELSAFSNITKKTATINRFASASIADSFEDFTNLKVDRAWRDFRKRLKEAQNIEITIPAALQAELRPYQEEGYRWMTRLAAWGAGACLADDMGLGKTVQAIASLLQRASMGPALVVSPVTVRANWISEVNRFAPSLSVKTLNNGDRTETLASLGAGDLLITSYGLLQSEEEALAAVEWATVVLDEAHAIKNYHTKTSKVAMSLKAGFRMILTGTPLQNHLGEMWNLFQFINPGLLGTLPHFTDHFIKPADNNARRRLKKLISPFILRRTKTAVLDELPPKTEIIRKIELSAEEMAFYEALRRRAIETIQNDDSPQGARHLKALAEITRLRQACCHPKLVEPKIDIGSTKLSTFMEIAAELKENGHRALVFSQFVTHLSLVRKALDNQGFSYQYLDGSTPPAKRETAVKQFQAGSGDLFLISLKAGGLGLNLTAADFVIHLDPWWNPAIEDQASDRAHRIGQNRPVTVYRLVAEHTIEEKIIKLHNTKRDLADSLLEGSDQSAKLSMEELLALIREG